MRRRQATGIASTHARRDATLRVRSPPERVAVQSWCALALAIASAFVLWYAATSESRAEEAARPRLHLYAAPKPYQGVDGITQRRALESWLALHPRPKVTLLGSSPELREVAREHGVETQPIDATFLAVPLFSAVLAAANQTSTAANADVVVLLNADIVVFDDFSTSLGKLQARFGRRPWVALGGRCDINKFPKLATSVTSRSRWRSGKLAAKVRSKGVLHTYGGIDAWAWPVGQLPAVGTVPSFVLGRGRYDNWFTDALLRSGATSLVDISEVATLAHVRHDHRLVRTGSLAQDPDPKTPYWMADPRLRYELYLNAHLAAAAGHVPQTGTLLDAPYKLSACFERVRAGACLFRRRRPHACRCEHAPFVHGAMSDPYVVTGSRVILCGLRSVDAVEDRTPHDVLRRWRVTGYALPGRRAVFGLPLTQQDILAVVRSRIADSAVVLVVAGDGDEVLVANTICAARRHGVFQRMVVAALDDELYRFGILLGWPVFLADSPSTAGVSTRTRRTLAIARQLLDAGVSVASLAPGVMVRANLTRHLGHALELGTDMALCSGRSGDDRGRGVTTDVIFVRGTKRSATVLDVALNNTGESPETTIEQIACGEMGTRGHLCRNRHIRVQFLTKDECAHIERGRGRRHTHEEFNAGDAAFILPDGRAHTLMRLEALQAHGLTGYDESTQLCRWT